MSRLIYLADDDPALREAAQLHGWTLSAELTGFELRMTLAF